MKIKEVSNLAGISVRTLHHYDEIGLLKPEQVSEAGYRLYSEKNLELLQQILFFRELGFPLKEIKEIVSSPAFRREDALQLHRKMLLDKRKQLDQMIITIDRTIMQTRGEIEMTNEQKFEGFDFSSNPYQQEARDRWGDEAVDKSNAKLGNKSKQEQGEMSESMNAIYTRLALLRNEPPDSDAAQAAIEEWYVFLNEMGSYSYEAFKGLGQMYVDDQRFTKNIDKFGEGLSLFMRNAMRIFAENHK